jgi:hypothetical protein
LPGARGSSFTVDVSYAKVMTAAAIASELASSAIRQL